MSLNHSVYIPLLIFAGAIGCSGNSDFSLRQRRPQAPADNKGVIVIEKDLLGNPLHCWTGNSAGMSGSYTFMDAGHGLHLYLNDRSTIVEISGEAWDTGFALLGLNREACKQLGHHVSSPSKMGWSVPSAPDDHAPPKNKIVP